ncbi:hypothetical protein [Aeromicrobium sp.]|nr:hypothetical protein [Aeromicrobium sp.]MBC7633635.1 hypothetical protein [Aeromicrobium sp.]
MPQPDAPMPSRLNLLVRSAVRPALAGIAAGALAAAMVPFAAANDG